MVNFEVDEHARPQTTIEGLRKLPTLFKQNGLVTAGSASVSIENYRDLLNHTRLIGLLKNSKQFCKNYLHKYLKLNFK